MCVISVVDCVEHVRMNIGGKTTFGTDRVSKRVVRDAHRMCVINLMSLVFHVWVMGSEM